MERDFYNEEFEDLIREKTDQYKMYPSEKVWKEIYSSLHTRRRFYIAGMSLLISGILIFAGRELISPSRKTRLLPGDGKMAALEAAGHNEPTAGKKSAFRNSAQFHQTLIPTLMDKQEETPIQEESLPPFAGNIAPITNADQNNQSLPAAEKTLSSVNLPPLAAEHHELNLDPSIAEPAGAQVLSVEEVTRLAAIQHFNNEDKKQLTWLKDQATQHLAPVKKHKLNWQVYITPTVNYRKLSGGNTITDSRSTVQNVPISLIHYGSANDLVDHTPAVGYEIGGALLYRITRNLTVKAGLQFDYSSYFIKAYHSTPELATIALNPYYGYYADSIRAYTSVRNFGGKSQENLQNRYYQLSLPVGLEMRVFGNGKLQFSIAGTIQPTYLFNSNNYLLTTDYAYYTKEPSLYRKWNLNGGLEAFLSYQIGGLRWQLGPQFRYQLLSTYTDNYPLKENLMEYGIKIGISKTIR